MVVFIKYLINKNLTSHHLSIVGLDFRVKTIEMDDALYKLKVIDKKFFKNFQTQKNILNQQMQ